MTITNDAKPCSNCRTEKQRSEFHKSAKAADGRASWCKACANSVARAARKRNYRKTDKRKWQLKTRYGLTPEAVTEMKVAQNNKCVLCPTELNDKFHIDHCHNTGAVRGLLCPRCNVRLGGWDDLVWRKAAMAYLGIAA